MHSAKQHINNELEPTPLIQPSMEVGESNDVYEQEADAVTDKVMSTPTNKIQPKMHSVDDGAKMSSGQKETEMAKMTSPVAIQKMSQASTGGMMASKNVEQGINSSKGAGQSLPQEIQQDFGGKMNADFSDVSIHTDRNAVNMNKEVGARAFTYGNDIYFNQGQYNPGSDEGKELLAHELTHTQQQGKGGANKIQRKMVVEGSESDKAVFKNMLEGVTGLTLAYSVSKDRKERKKGENRAELTVTSLDGPDYVSKRLRSYVIKLLCPKDSAMLKEYEKSLLEEGKEQPKVEDNDQPIIEGENQPETENETSNEGDIASETNLDAVNVVAVQSLYHKNLLFRLISTPILLNQPKSKTTQKMAKEGYTGDKILGDDYTSAVWDLDDVELFANNPALLANFIAHVIRERADIDDYEDEVERREDDAYYIGTNLAGDPTFATAYFNASYFDTKVLEEFVRDENGDPVELGFPEQIIDKDNPEHDIVTWDYGQVRVVYWIEKQDKPNLMNPLGGKVIKGFIETDPGFTIIKTLKE